MNTADANREAQSSSRPHRGEHLDLLIPLEIFDIYKTARRGLPI
jgi:hypothetical protein